MTASRAQAPVDLLQALAVLAEPPEEGHARVADALGLGPVPDGAAYADVFLFQFYPYASVYLGAEGMLGGEARDRIAGFWRAVGRTPPAEPDHLSALLGLYAALVAETSADPAREAMARQSAAALLHEHLAPWALAYLDRVAEATSGFYEAWATVAAAALRQALDAVEHPATLPVHLQVAPGLPDPRVDGGDGFAAALMAPVRTGMIVTRADLAVVGRTLGLGLRLGERRFILEHLLAQDTPGVLAALAELAEMAKRSHRARRPALGEIADFWAERAGGSAVLLRALALEGEAALTRAGAVGP